MDSHDPEVGSHSEHTLDPAPDPAEVKEKSRLRREELTQVQRALELEALREKAAKLHRVRDAAGGKPMLPRSHNVPLQTPGPGESIAASEVANSKLSDRYCRLRDPIPFKGESMKEARLFLRELQVMFAFGDPSYWTDHKQVVYGVMFLAGKASDKWHQSHNLKHLTGYTFQDFERFVQNVVGDLWIREKEAAIAYNTAFQREDQTVKSFAEEMSLIEDELPVFPEKLKVLLLLAKLKPSVQDAITVQRGTPETREELVWMAESMENALQRSGKREGTDLLPHYPTKQPRKEHAGNK